MYKNRELSKLLESKNIDFKKNITIINGFL